ncbi:MAG: tRNA-dihydrouridine synthase family protein [Eubacteriales bacterium]
MKYYGAPMEGVNTAFYRNAQNELFGGVDKFYSPFLVPNDGIRFKRKQLMDILPERNQGINLIPQLLTNKVDDFVRASKEIQELGYIEINLNLGCPSGTVVTKKKGSGFLAYPEELDAFLYEIYSQCDVAISIKTRLGIAEPEEFYKILEIYNKYKMPELIIHPRIQKDMYKYPPNMDMFKNILQESKNPICYNGDIFTPEDAREFAALHPEIDSVMIGRGLITNPALIREIKEGMQLQKDEFRKIHDRLYNDYQEYLSGDTNLLYRMKEYWYYMNHSFIDGKKHAKKIRKTTQLSTYNQTVDALFAEKEVGGYFNPY